MAHGGTRVLSCTAPRGSSGFTNPNTLATAAALKEPFRIINQKDVRNRNAQPTCGPSLRLAHLSGVRVALSNTIQNECSQVSGLDLWLGRASSG